MSMAAAATGDSGKCVEYSKSNATLGNLFFPYGTMISASTSRVDELYLTPHVRQVTCDFSFRFTNLPLFGEFCP